MPHLYPEVHEQFVARVNKKAKAARVGKIVSPTITGAIDDQMNLHLATEIFIEDKPAHYAFANHTVKQTGQVAMAAFVATGDSANDRT